MDYLIRVGHLSEIQYSICTVCNKTLCGNNTLAQSYTIAYIHALGITYIYIYIYIYSQGPGFTWNECN